MIPKRPCGLFAALFLIASMAQAEPWDVREFEVYEGKSTLLGDLPWPSDNPLPDAVRLEIEAFLREVATMLEDAGWRQPYIEPVLPNSAGRPAFRVYYYDIEASWPAARVVDQCGTVTPRLFINGNKFLVDGKIPPKGYQDLAHEVFHGVQARYPLFRQSCTDSSGNGDWIAEGTAQALGADLAAYSSWGIDYPHSRASDWPAHRWGLRSYDRPLYLQAPRSLAYGSSSFWRYLGEYAALAGGAGSTAVKPDYTYLQKFFDSSFPVPLTPSGSLTWLDRQVSDRGKGIHLGLDRLYPSFITTFAAYGGTRVNPQRPDSNDAEQNAQANRRIWLDNVFLRDKCPSIEMSSGQTSDRIGLGISPYSAQCVQLRWNRAQAQDIHVRAIHDDKARLADLALGTREGAVVMEPTLVMVQDKWSATWTVAVEPGTAPVEFIFANAGAEVEATQGFIGQVQFGTPGWHSNLWQGPLQAHPAGPAAGDEAPGVLTKKAQDSRVAKETEKALKQLNPNLLASSTISRAARQAPCAEAFVDIACGPTTTISLELLPGGMYGSGWTSSGRGGVFGQFAGMLSGMGQISPGDFSQSIGAAVAAQEAIDGAKVTIILPLIDYGFTGAFNNAELRVSARGGETYRAIGPNDIQPGPGRRYPLSGRVSIETYSPWEASGTFSANLVNVDRLNLVGDDPSLPTDQTINGRFYIVAPWRNDQRAIIESSEEAADAVLADVAQMMGGASPGTEQRIREAMARNAGSQEAGRVAYVEPACDCSCNIADQPKPACLPRCSATYAACKGLTVAALKRELLERAPQAPYLRTLPDACEMLNGAVGKALLETARTEPSGPRDWLPQLSSQCGLRDAVTRTGEVSLQMLLTPRSVVDSALMSRDELRARALGFSLLGGGRTFDVEQVGNIGFGLVADGRSTLKVFTGIYGVTAGSDTPGSELVLTYSMKDPDQEDPEVFRKLYLLAKSQVDQLRQLALDSDAQ